MEGFCRGCLIKYNEPTDLIQYSEKSRRLFIYSTGLQVKRNDTFTFQLCKDCYLNIKSASKFKKQCRSSDKKIRNFMALKSENENMDFCNFLRNNDDALNFRFPTFPENGTPATQTDDDNESICASIRNFMTDILQGEEMPDTEARIIKEVIEEEADVMDDSLDSHWLQDDVSVDTDFRMDFNFSPFSTPNSIENDHCYTPKRSPGRNGENNKTPQKFYAPNPIMDHSNDIVDEIMKENKEISFFSYNNHDSKTENNIIENNDFINEIDKKLLDIDSQICCDNAINNDSNLNFNIDDSLDTKLNSIKTELNKIKPETPAKIKAEDESKKDENYYLPRDFVEVPVHIAINEKDNNIQDNVHNEAKDNIDKNLEQALKNNLNDEFSLDDLLGPPTDFPRIMPPTPTITNILFGEKLDLESNSNGSEQRISQCIEKYENVEGNIQVLEEFFDMKDTIFNLGHDNVITPIKKNENVKKLINEMYDFDNCYCKKCNKQFLNLKALRIHSQKLHNFTIKKQRGRFECKMCDECGKEFNNRTDYWKHKKQHLDLNVVYKCDTCKLTFSNESTMAKHMVTHTGSILKKDSDKKHLCSICGASFNFYNNMRLHKLRHSKNYSVKCDDCGKGFFRKYDLDIHKRIHTGDMPFKCGFCEKMYARRTSLVAHIQTHIGPGYVCDHCDTKFAMKRYIVSHLMKSKKCSQIRDRLSTQEKKKPKNTVNVTYLKGSKEKINKVISKP